MAKVPHTIDHIKTRKYVLNVESVGLSPEQFFRLCGDNPELRLELTAQKEIIVMSPTKSKTGMLNAEINPVYRPNQAPQILNNPITVSGEPELQGFSLDLTEIWK
jgi:Uma2 family endonuclease